MNLHEGIGFKYLSHQEQQAYKVMLSAFASMAVSINSSQIHHSVDLMKVMQVVLGDNPSIIYFDKTNIEIEESNLGKRIILTGVHSKPQAEKMNLSLDVYTNQIISMVKAASHDEYSMLIKLYELLQKNIQYDKEEFQALSRGISSNPASHNAYGTLMKKLAVCDGFSSAFALLAQKLGFECMLVVGKLTDSSALLVDHAWNIIKIRNKYYHMDNTGDSRHYIEFNEFSYAYFAVTNEEMAYDHTWNKTTTPICSDNDFSYYLRNGLYVNNKEQLDTILKTFRKNHSSVIRIRLSHKINLPKNAGEYLGQLVLKEVVKIGGQVIYSWNENTKCFFAKNK